MIDAEWTTASLDRYLANATAHKRIGNRLRYRACIGIGIGLVLFPIGIVLRIGWLFALGCLAVWLVALYAYVIDRRLRRLAEEHPTFQDVLDRAYRRDMRDSGILDCAYAVYGFDPSSVVHAVECHESHLAGDCPLCGGN